MQMWYHLIIFLFFILFADYEAHSHTCIDDIVSLIGGTTLVVLSVDLIISPLLGHFEDFSLSCLEKLGLSFSSLYEGVPPPPPLKMKGLQSKQHTSTKKTNLIPRYDETIAKINTLLFLIEIHLLILLNINVGFNTAYILSIK